MSNERLHADVLRLIEENGAMGVNQLSKALDVPLSTMQKYLDKDQDYFKKNNARKWVLPEMSAVSDMSVVSSNYSNVIDSQLTSMQALIDTLMSQFRATVSLIDANKGTLPPVAGIAPDIHKSMIESDKRIKSAYEVFKKFLGVVPEEYKNLIKNVDLHRLTIELGTIKLNEQFNPEITALFLEKSVDLSDDVLRILKEYQKEVKL
jgi:hypothetical protein